MLSAAGVAVADVGPAKAITPAALRGKKPTHSQNEFGCDQTGVLDLNGIEGTAPTVTRKGVPVINPKFYPVFDRFLNDVVLFNTAESPIPARLVRFFGPNGYFCAAAQRSVIEDYGFEPSSNCGHAF